MKKGSKLRKSPHQVSVARMRRVIFVGLLLVLVSGLLATELMTMPKKDVGRDYNGDVYYGKEGYRLAP